MRKKVLFGMILCATTLFACEKMETDAAGGGEADVVSTEKNLGGGTCIEDRLRGAEQRLNQELRVNENSHATTGRVEQIDMQFEVDVTTVNGELCMTTGDLKQLEKDIRLEAIRLRNDRDPQFAVIQALNIESIGAGSLPTRKLVSIQLFVGSRGAQGPTPFSNPRNLLAVYEQDCGMNTIGWDAMLEVEWLLNVNVPWHVNNSTQVTEYENVSFHASDDLSLFMDANGDDIRGFVPENWCMTPIEQYEYFAAYGRWATDNAPLDSNGDPKKPVAYDLTVDYIFCCGAYTTALWNYTVIYARIDGPVTHS